MEQLYEYSFNFGMSRGIFAVAPPILDFPSGYDAFQSAPFRLVSLFDTRSVWRHTAPRAEMEQTETQFAVIYTVVV